MSKTSDRDHDRDAPSVSTHGPLDADFGVTFDKIVPSSPSPSIGSEWQKSPSPSHLNKQENLTIRQTDEIRIVSAVTHASTQKLGHNSLGSIFSVKVDLSQTDNHTLSIGIKDLPNNLLCVSMLKRVNGRKGPGELAGVQLGDIIFGNYLIIFIYSFLSLSLQASISWRCVMDLKHCCRYYAQKLN
jgi:hypothetical protein